MIKTTTFQRCQNIHDNLTEPEEPPEYICISCGQELDNNGISSDELSSSYCEHCLDK